MSRLVATFSDIGIYKSASSRQQLSRQGWRNILGKVHPVLGLGVFRVVNLLRGVDCRVKVLKDAAGLLLLAIDQQSIAATKSTESAL